MKVLDCKSSAELELIAKASIAKIVQVTISKEQVEFKSKHDSLLVEGRDPEESNLSDNK